jgi:preprotein translocase subunit SecG
MQAVVLTIHLLVCIALIGLVLLQRSEGGALGMGGGNSGALMSGRGAADALARMTQIAGFAFLITSLSLTVLSGAASSQGQSVFDLLPRLQHSAPAPAPTPPVPVTPAHPDPTQSSAPEAAQTQLASVPATSAAVPQATQSLPASTGGAHAAPLQAGPALTTAAPLTASRTTATPVSATTSAPARVNPPPAQRSTSATTQAASTTATHPLVLPSSRSAAALTNDTSATESADAATGPQPVRRERAGPDQ